MRGRLRHVARIFGFALSMVLFAAATLWSIPALIQSGGLEEWGHIAVGQAIGVIGGIAGGYGWLLSGPASVARATSADRRTEYLESLKLRLLLLPLVLIGSGVAALLLVPAEPIAAIIGSLTTSLLALRASWFFVGIGAPWQLLAWETVPRVVAVVISVPLMRLGTVTALQGLLIQVIGIIASIGMCSFAVVTTTKVAAGKQRARLRPISELLRVHGHGVVAQTVSSLSGSAPLIIVGSISPAAAPIFALLYRVQLQISTAAAPLIDYLQGWVPRSSIEARVRRSWVSVSVVAVMCVVGSVVFVLIGHNLLMWLSAAKTDVPLIDIVLTAASISVGLISQVTTRVVMPAIGRLRELSRNSLVSAVVGTVAVGVLSIWARVPGALVGVLLGLVFLTALNLIVLYSYASRPARSAADLSRDQSSIAGSVAKDAISAAEWSSSADPVDGTTPTVVARGLDDVEPEVAPGR